MRIRDLNKHEDFWSIFKETIKLIILEKSLYKQIFSNKRNQILISQSSINYISPPFVGKNTYKVLINEYSKSNVFWKRPFQFMFVHLATTQIIRFLFTDKIIVAPYRMKNNILIIGGNHRIRFIDFQSIKSLVVLKDKENDIFIKNEIKYRSKVLLPYSPKLYEWGQAWIAEELIDGVPINRGLDNSKIEQYKKCVYTTHYTKLIAPSLKLILLNNYINKKIDEFILHFNQIPSIIKNKVYSYIDINTIYGLKNLFKKNRNTFPVSITHGDFQNSNILISDKKPIVIDWENMSMRFCLYDEFVLFSDIRSMRQYDIYNSILRYHKFIKEKYEVNKLRERYLSSVNFDLTAFLIAFEELFFVLYDEISNNYFRGSKKLINIIDFLKTNAPKY